MVKFREKTIALSIVTMGFLTSFLIVFLARAEDTDAPSLTGIFIEGKNITEWINMIYIWGTGIIGILAMLVLVFAGITYITSAGNPEMINKAKAQITAALAGVVILLLSYTILHTIDPRLTKMGLIVKKLELPENPGHVLGSSCESSSRCHPVAWWQQGIYANPEGLDSNFIDVNQNGKRDEGETKLGGGLPRCEVGGDGNFIPPSSDTECDVGGVCRIKSDEKCGIKDYYPGNLDPSTDVPTSDINIMGCCDFNYRGVNACGACIKNTYHQCENAEAAFSTTCELMPYAIVISRMLNYYCCD